MLFVKKKKIDLIQIFVSKNNEETGLNLLRLYLVLNLGVKCTFNNDFISVIEYSQDHFANEPWSLEIPHNNGIKSL